MKCFFPTKLSTRSCTINFASSTCKLVVEPLRALIFSQVKELTQRSVNVARLLSRDDVNHPGDLYGPDYLHHLSNNFDNEKSLIIFSTPELLSKCCEKNGTIYTLVKKRLLSLIVIDEFDYIDECHQQHRNAYTTIVPSLKRATERSHVPFLYLSATGSSHRIFDILFANSAITNLNTTRPVLVQTDHILPHNHIYKGKTFMVRKLLNPTFISSNLWY